jgi:segregation and condensation protein A
LPHSDSEGLAGESTREPRPAETPVHEPGSGPAPVIDPTPGLEPDLKPDPDPNPDPHPDDPDPEPDRDPDPGPPVGPDPDPDELPRTDPPVDPDQAPIKAQESKAQESEAPLLVLTSKPVPPEKVAKTPKPKKPEEVAEYSPFSVFVGQVYDGPLDLLLDLIRKQDIDIYDIPIAKITAQFLAYVNQLKATDVDVAGEFIYTASLLIHIKSKMLLPRAPSGPEDAAEDPRRELVERLLEHERFKNAAQMLQQKQMLEAATWTNPGIREFKDDVAAEPEIAADTDDLVRIFRDVLDRIRKRPIFNIQDDSVTVGQMIQFLGRRLTMEDKPVALRKLLSHTKSERALVAMFLALLELVRVQAVLLRQDRAFSEIFIKKHSGFDAVMNEGLAGARDDWR